jgi:hypothetical protein
MTTYTWRCTCGRVFFDINVAKSSVNMGRYIFRIACPDCNKLCRRCFTMAHYDYALARAMIVRQNGCQDLRAKRFYKYPNAKHPMTEYAKRMLGYMLTRGRYSLVRTTRIMGKVGVPPRMVNSIAGGMAVKVFTLENPPPHLHRQIVERRAVLRHVEMGAVTDACIFCRIAGCSRRGNTCKMLKIDATTMRYVQTGGQDSAAS